MTGNATILWLPVMRCKAPLDGRASGAVHANDLLDEMKAGATPFVGRGNET